MQPQRQHFITPEEYLELERQAETKSEYFRGETYAMAGASRAHNLIVTNAILNLGTRLKGRPCEIYANDMRVKVGPTGLYTYPDIVVVCGRPMFEDRCSDTLLNPTIIAEVLSQSTESYDRGIKFEHYRTLESLTDYLLISQDKASIEHRTRQSGDTWLLGIYQGVETIVPLSSLAVELPLAEIYDKIEWSDEYAARGWLRVVKEPQAEYRLDQPGDPTY